MLKNVIFWVQLEDMQIAVQKTPCPTKEVIQKFKYVLKFKISMHHIYLQAHRDKDQEWMPCKYQLDGKPIEYIIIEWIPELNVPIVEEEIQEEEQDREVWKEALRNIVKKKENNMKRSENITRVYITFYRVEPSVRGSACYDVTTWTKSNSHHGR